MRKRFEKSPQKRGGERAEPAKLKTLPKPAGAETTNKTEANFAAKRFVNDLIIRGEAAKKSKKGKLPLRATHAIKRQNRDGTVEVERVRFKTF